MTVNSVGIPTGSQLYQLLQQKNSGTAQAASAQGPEEEKGESAAVQKREVSEGGESREAGSIDTYA